MSSRNLISIVTPNFQTFHRKRKDNCQSGRQRPRFGCLAGRPLPKKSFAATFWHPFYGQVDKDLTSTDQQIVKSAIKDLIVKQELPATATNLIITTPRTSCIYFLLKIHKPNNLGRPIVSARNCPTELISSYLDKIMAPIVRSLTSYVKDSQHALQILSDFNFLGEDKLIFTMDIASLYTVIPNADGLLALKHFLIYALLRNQARKRCSAWLN